MPSPKPSPRISSGPDRNPADGGSTSPLPLGQHNVEIQINREAWDRKPVLRKIYHEFYRLIASRLDPTLPGPIAELGSGMGRIKEVIPQCILTDLFPNPWLDRQENCYQLTFADGELSHLILFDVWHHLRFPAPRCGNSIGC